MSSMYDEPSMAMEARSKDNTDEYFAHYNQGKNQNLYSTQFYQYVLRCDSVITTHDIELDVNIMNTESTHSYSPVLITASLLPPLMYFSVNMEIYVDTPTDTFPTFTLTPYVNNTIPMLSAFPLPALTFPPSGTDVVITPSGRRTFIHLKLAMLWNTSNVTQNVKSIVFRSSIDLSNLNLKTTTDCNGLLTNFT